MSCVAFSLRAATRDATATPDYRAPSAAKVRSSRSSRLGTHTRSAQAHLLAVQSSPPRRFWFCIADMPSQGFLNGPTRYTTPCDRVKTALLPPSRDNPPASDAFRDRRKKEADRHRKPTTSRYASGQRLTDHCVRRLRPSRRRWVSRPMCKAFEPLGRQR
jgi:hypothetical protein